MLGKDIAACVKKGESKNPTNQQTNKKHPKIKHEKPPRMQVVLVFIVAAACAALRMAESCQNKKCGAASSEVPWICHIKWSGMFCSLELPSFSETLCVAEGNKMFPPMQHSINILCGHELSQLQEQSKKKPDWAGQLPQQRKAMFCWWLLMIALQLHRNILNKCWQGIQSH